MVGAKTRAAIVMLLKYRILSKLMSRRLGINRACRKSQGTIISGATLKFENNVKVKAHIILFYFSSFLTPTSRRESAKRSTMIKVTPAWSNIL